MTSAFSVGLYKLVVFLSSRGFGFIFIINKESEKGKMDAQNLDEFVILLRPKSSVNRAKARSCIRERLRKPSPN